MAKKEKKKQGTAKLKSLLPKVSKKPFIIRMPEEKDENIHWLFWVLVFLVLLFLVSLIFINWQESSAMLSYLN